MGSFTLPTPSSVPGGATLPEASESDFFGEDILFTDDLQVTAFGDYALVEGGVALRQAILIRLLVAPGEYATRPDFGVGIRQWVKKRLTTAEMDDVRQRIIDQLSKEDRIEKVSEVTIERNDVGDNTGIKLMVRVVALGREQTFAFPNFSE